MSERGGDDVAQWLNSNRDEILAIVHDTANGGDPDAAARLLAQIWEVVPASTDATWCHALRESGHQLAAHLPSSRMMATVFRRSAAWFITRGDHRIAEAEGMLELATWSRMDDPGGYVAALTALAATFCALGRWNRVIDCAIRQLAVHLRCQHTAEIPHDLQHLGAVMLQAHRPDTAAHYLTRARDALDELPAISDQQHADVRVLLGRALWLTGAFSQARRQFSGALQLVVDVDETAADHIRELLATPSQSPLVADEHKAFVPDIHDVPADVCHDGDLGSLPLPSDLDLPSTTCRRVAEAECALGRLDEAAKRSSMPQVLVRSTRLRDARSSASLDGVHLGLAEVLVADLAAAQEPSKRPDLVSRIAPYMQTYNHGVDRVRAGVRIDTGLISELSAIMTGRVEPSLLDQLHQLSDWAENDTHQPRVVHTAIAQYQLEVLRPFSDAVTGHIAREVSMLHLMRKGLLHDQILALSVGLDETRVEYQTQIKEGTGLVHWVEFFSTVIRDQAHAQLTLIDRLEEFAAEFAGKANFGVTRHVIADLVRVPVINHKTIAERYDVTYRCARNVTRHLIDLGILTSWETSRYDQIFFCDPVLDLLE